MNCILNNIEHFKNWKLEENTGKRRGNLSVRKVGTKRAIKFRQR